MSKLKSFQTDAFQDEPEKPSKEYDYLDTSENEKRLE